MRREGRARRLDRRCGSVHRLLSKLYRGAIEISRAADDASGGYGGVAYRAEHGAFAPEHVQHVIIRSRSRTIESAAAIADGWWAEIETYGAIAHGSTPFLGECAVRHMGALINAYEETLYPAMPAAPKATKSSTFNISSSHGGQPERSEGSTALPSP